MILNFSEDAVKSSFNAAFDIMNNPPLDAHHIQDSLKHDMCEELWHYI